MTFVREQLHPACGFDSNNGPRIWSYKTQDEIGIAAGDVMEAGVYFSGDFLAVPPVGAADLLQAGDFIVVQGDAEMAPPGSQVSIIAVATVVGNTVTTTTATGDLDLG
ncbi:MAG: hypothetical protein ACR2PR_11620 [Pseudohongiellaceae bacterium]